MGSKKDKEQQTGGGLQDTDENRQQILKPGKSSTAAKPQNEISDFLDVGPVSLSVR